MGFHKQEFPSSHRSAPTPSHAIRSRKACGSIVCSSCATVCLASPHHRPYQQRPRDPLAPPNPNPGGTQKHTSTHCATVVQNNPSPCKAKTARLPIDPRFPFPPPDPPHDPPHPPDLVVDGIRALPAPHPRPPTPLQYRKNIAFPSRPPQSYGEAPAAELALVGPEGLPSRGYPGLPDTRSLVSELYPQTDQCGYHGNYDHRSSRSSSGCVHLYIHGRKEVQGSFEGRLECRWP